MGMMKIDGYIQCDSFLVKRVNSPVVCVVVTVTRCQQQALYIFTGYQVIQFLQLFRIQAVLCVQRFGGSKGYYSCRRQFLYFRREFIRAQSHTPDALH